MNMHTEGRSDFFSLILDGGGQQVVAGQGHTYLLFDVPDHVT